MDVWCEYTGHYSTSYSIINDYQIRELYSTMDGIEIQVTKYGTDFKIPYYQDYSDDLVNVRYVTDTTINDIVYNEVYVLQKDTISGSPRISQAIKSVDKGVVEFYDYQHKQKWSLIN